MIQAKAELEVSPENKLSEGEGVQQVVGMLGSGVGRFTMLMTSGSDPLDMLEGSEITRQTFSNKPSFSCGGDSG